MFSAGRKHDFKLFKDSKLPIAREIKLLIDNGYQGIEKWHKNAELPKKRSKKNLLTALDKEKNRKLSSERVMNEHIIGSVKRFKIIADKYRNRRKRFGLRFTLIAAISNYELAL